MEGLTADQCLEHGHHYLEVENLVEAMRFFGHGLKLAYPDPRLLSGFQGAASAFCHQLINNELEQRYPVYHGVERLVNYNARHFYLPGMNAFLDQDYELARLFFSEALTWDATNNHLLQCFRTSVELGYQGA